MFKGTEDNTIRNFWETDPKTWVIKFSFDVQLISNRFNLLAYKTFEKVNALSVELQTSSFNHGGCDLLVRHVGLTRRILETARVNLQAGELDLRSIIIAPS